jgi:hypothetical protein
MIPPPGGRALESKKRCHDLVPREIDNRDFFKKEYAFPGRSKNILTIMHYAKMIELY